MKSMKQFIVSTFSSLRGTSVIPSSISFCVRSLLFYFCSRLLNASDKHVSCLLSFRASINFLVVWGLTVDQLTSSSWRWCDCWRYSTTIKKGPSLCRMLTRASFLSWDCFMIVVINCSMREPAILQSIILSSSKWWGSLFCRSGARFSIDLELIPFILYMIDLKSFSLASPSRIIAN